MSDHPTEVEQILTGTDAPSGLVRRRISLGDGEIITLTRFPEGGSLLDTTIVRDDDNAHYNGMVDGFESLILALFDADVELPTDAILAAWEAIGNHTE